MDVIIALLSVLVGLVIGFFLGTFSIKRFFNEKLYDSGFQDGYAVAKDNFYNPQAKG